jgi:predicted ribosome quality control (RQC) complex YloA/Tae2 family protein
MKTESVFISRLNQSVTYHIGQNAKDNFAVIDSAESSHDIWFHAAEESSCHVVGLVPEAMDKKVRHLIIKQGALLCKIHTPKLRAMKNAEIIYTEINNVKKTAVDGQVSIEGRCKKVCI